MPPPPAASDWTRMAESGTSPRPVIEPGRLRAKRSSMRGATIAMSTSIIIDARDRLRWHQRFACDASTAALWGGWLWLWAPLLKAGGSLARLGVDLPPWLPKLLPIAAYARHFELPEQVIEAGRGAATCVVHHDAEGRIARIECRGPVAQA